MTHYQRPDLGRYLFGGVSLLWGLAGLALNAQLISSKPFSTTAAFIVAVSAAQVIGGSALLVRHLIRPAAIILGITYLVSAVRSVPAIVSNPGTYASWGNAFYALAVLAGAMLLFAAASPRASYARPISRAAIVLFGLSCISFGIEQLEFLSRTNGLVPTWIPPSGMFWSIVTTIAFWLAGISLIVNYQSLLAARLLTAMLLLFGLAVWIPALITNPSLHSNWSEGLDTFAIAASAWIAAEALKIGTKS